MQVTETLNEGLKRGYQITITAAELDEKVNAKLAEAQPEIEMKGFRKGKVPMALLKKQFGQRVLGEAMQEAVDGAMSGHFEESGDRPALQPDVKMIGENWKEGDDVVVEMAYEALPEIPEPDFTGLALEKLTVKADESSVTEALDELAGQARNFEDRDDGAAAEDGDQVVLDFVGKIDGEPFEGGTADDFPLVLGSGQFIPGFEEQLVGVTAGSETSVELSFPEDYQAAHLAGKAAVFDCTIKSVKAPAAAVVDDDMAKQFGAGGLDAPKQQIRDRLEAEYAGAARQVMKRALLDKLDALVSFDLPPTLVDAEAKQIAYQLSMEEASDEAGQESDASSEADPQPATDSPKDVEPNEEHTKLAERRVRLGLLLAELGRKKEIEVSDAEMTQAVLTQARQYPGKEREFFEFVQQNQQMQQQLRAPIFEDKVVDYIFELADVSEIESDKDALKAAVEALDED